MSSVTIIISLYNNSSTISYVLDSLAKQDQVYDILDKLTIVDDCSKDNSVKICTNHPFVKQLIKLNKFQLIRNSKNIGLAACYNKGIRATRSELVITLHGDCVLAGSKELKTLIEPFKDKRIVATYPVYITPKDIWLKYPFWQKVFFARFVDKEIKRLDGKFDAFRREALLKIGLFDEARFRTAGEDRDIQYRLEKVGQIVYSGAKVYHLHNISPKFGIKDYLKKESQLAECYGAILSKHLRRSLKNISSLLRLFIRPLICSLPFISLISNDYILLLLLLLFSLLYSYKVFYIRDSKIILMPLINTLVFYCYTFYFFKGLINRRQTI